ncbi:MAG: hypothetical protein DRJ03_03200 [Chloroflexi bacterium]|nr:MAG: hypothetical protein DRJ03_03200 [Chloroflexota bacterium]
MNNIKVSGFFKPCKDQIEALISLLQPDNAVEINRAVMDVLPGVELNLQIVNITYTFSHTLGEFSISVVALSANTKMPGVPTTGFIGGGY